MYRDQSCYLPKPNDLILATMQENAQNETLALILIDEISNIGPEMFAQIEMRMRQIMQSDLPFGGVSRAAVF